MCIVFEHTIEFTVRTHICCTKKYLKWDLDFLNQNLENGKIFFSFIENQVKKKQSREKLGTLFIQSGKNTKCWIPQLQYTYRIYTAIDV